MDFTAPHPHIPVRTDRAAGRRLSRRRLVLAAAALALVAGCGSDEPTGPPPTPVTASVEASPFLNPDRNNRPSPVVVIVYGLTDDAKFKGAGFFELYEQDEATLGEAIKTRQEFIIAPGDVEDLSLEIDGTATFLAVLAAYRDIDNAQFKAIAAMTPGEPFNVQIKLQSAAIVLVTPEAPIVTEDGETSDGSS